MDDSKTEVQFIAMQSPIARLINAVMGYVATFLGIFLLMAFSIKSYPDPSSVEAQIIIFSLILLPLGTSFLALRRNKIICFIFKKLSGSMSISLIDIGKKFRWSIIIIAFTSLAVGIVTAVILNTNANLMASGFILVFLFMPIFAIFSDPITTEGEIRIVFEQLFSSLDDFVVRQRWLRLVSKSIEENLKIANIKIGKGKLVFYFNMELLRGRNIYGNLKDIEACILGEKRHFFETLNEIVPEKEFEVYERNLILKQTLKNPIALNWIIILALVGILWIINPTSVMEFLSRYIP